jgi:hypothetical protein
MNNIKEKKEVNQSEFKNQLKEANRAYTECISKDFLGRFLAGEAVKLDDFCMGERLRMKELDLKVYGELHL